MQTKSLTNRIPYTFIRGGYYYFSRRVPADLQCHYRYPRVVQGLNTASPQKARIQANIEAAKLDAYWSQMRLARSDVLGLSLVKGLPQREVTTADTSPVAIVDQPENAPTLLDALQLYLGQNSSMGGGDGFLNIASSCQRSNPPHNALGYLSWKNDFGNSQTDLLNLILVCRLQVLLTYYT
jgi:hypothetical protein